VTSIPSELPAALAAISLDQIEEFEKSSGRGFGEMIDEFSRGTWSISTMRAIVGLIAPDAPVETLGDLVDAAAALNPKKADETGGA
jgi:hypothetical protein